MISCPRFPPFLEAGTPDLLWLHKSQRKASANGGGGGGVEDFGTEKNQPKNRGLNNGGGNQTEKSGEGRGSRINRDYTVKAGKAQESHRSALLYLSPSLQKKNNKEPRTIDNRHHHCLVSFILKQRRQNANKEKKQRERTQAEESHEIAATAFTVSRTRRESKGKQKKEQRRGGNVGQPELPHRCLHPGKLSSSSSANSRFQNGVQNSAKVN